MTADNDHAPRRRRSRIAARCRRLWHRMRPEARTVRAISTTGIVIAIGYGCYAGSWLHTGLRPWADIGIGAGVALLAVLLMPLLFAAVRGLFGLATQLLGVFGAGALVVLAILLGQTAGPVEVALVMAPAAALPAAIWIGAVAAMTRGDFGARRVVAKVAIVAFLLVGLAGNGAFVWWLTSEGSAEHARTRPADATDALPPAFAGASPAEPGALAHDVLSYGSGDSRRREAFGAGADLRTETVNGRPFVTMPKGFKGNVREHYWGFDAGHLPVNGTIWAPQGEGPFPLVLCVHGNHGMFESSDPGYAYLGELFASRGYLFVSVDQNFLNSGGLVHGGMRRENDARAWLLLEHLRVWRQWNSSAEHRFAGKVDMQRIALIGHSRGGEAVCLATVFNRLRHYPDDASVAFDYGFAIRTVISIAPVDGQYRAADHDTAMRDVNFFTIHGGHDADVTRFLGDRLYRRLTFTDAGASCCKASLWLYRANHGQFNTVWGAYDASALRAHLLNDAALMSGEDQRRIAKVFLSAFLDLTLRGDEASRELFRDVRTARQLVPASAILIARYEDPSFRLVADFEEDVDVTTTTVHGGAIAATGFAVWREGDIPMRRDGTRDDHGVELGWDRSPAAADGASDGDTAPEPQAPAVYELTLPPGFDATNPLTGTDVLTFALAASKTKPKAKDYSDPPADNDDREEDGEGNRDGEEQRQDDATTAADEEEEPDDRSRIAEPITLSIELEDAAGATSRRPLRDFGTLLPPLEVVVRRDGLFASQWRKTFEPVLQTFRCPLAAFAADGFDVTTLRKIRLVFDGTDKGAVYLDRLGFCR